MATPSGRGRVRRTSGLAEGTLDLETRTAAVLSGSEMDFYRLVTLGDAEKDPRKQLVLYGKAKELYGNPMIQERIDATRQRIPKESRSSRFWRISGYASPAFLVGFTLAFYGLFADFQRSTQSLEQQLAWKLAGAHAAVAAAEKNTSEADTRRQNAETELVTWEHEHADVLERKKRIGALENEAATYRKKIDDITGARNALADELGATKKARDELQRKYDTEHQQYDARIKALDAELANLRSAYSTERAVREKAENQLQYRVNSEKKYAENLATLEAARAKAEQDYAQAQYAYSQEHALRLQIEKQLQYRKENKAEIKVTQTEVWDFGSRILYNLCESNGVGAWLSQARLRIWRTHDPSQDTIHIKTSVKPLIFDNVPIEAIRIEARRCLQNHRYDTPKQLYLHQYRSFLEGPNWVEVIISGWDDHTHPVSVTLAGFDPG